MQTAHDADALPGRISALLDAGDGAAALALARPAAAQAAAAGDLRAAVRLHVLASAAARSLGDRLLSEDCVQAAEALAQQAGQDDRDDLMLVAGTARARSHWTAGDAVEGLAHLEATWQRHQEGAREPSRQAARLIFGALCGNLCQIDEAIGWFQAVLDVAEANGDEPRQRLALGNLAACAIERADALQRSRSLTQARPWFVEAEQRIRAAWGRIEASDNVLLRLALHVNLAHALCALGRLDEAEACLEAARGLAPRPVHQDNLWTLWAFQLARLRAAQGRLDEAREALQPLLDEAAATGEDPLGSDIHRLAAELAERRGDAALALAHYKRHLQAERSRLADEADARTRLDSLRTRLRRAQEEAERLRQEILRDPLTGLANRRALEEAIAARRARRQGEGAPAHGVLCVAMIDVDHFKQVNDHHSHAVGDEVLRRLARILVAHCRAVDLAVRQGGEEFVVLLDGVHLGEAASACERLRAAVEAVDWASLSPGLAVTVSIGVAPVDAAGDMARALADADAALYSAKRAGRNRVHPAGVTA